MLKDSFRSCCLFLGCVSLLTLTATAQEIVHALTGTVTSINSAAKTIQVKTDDGSEGLFKVLTNANAPIDFEQKVRADAIPAASFTRTNTQVLVYYFGDGDERTAVALEDLGAAPLVKVPGTIVSFKRHEHLLTIKNASGRRLSFHLDDKTVAETAEGVTEGERLAPNKGDQVRVIAKSANGTETAVFIRDI